MTQRTTRSRLATGLVTAALSVSALGLAACGTSSTTAPTTPGVSAPCSTAINGVKHFIAAHPGSTGAINGKTVLAYQALYKQVVKSCPPSEIIKLTTKTIQPWIKSIKSAK
jgi:hypothetical protein